MIECDLLERSLRMGDFLIAAAGGALGATTVISLRALFRRYKRRKWFNDGRR